MGKRLRIFSRWLALIYIGIIPVIIGCTNQKSDAAQEPTITQNFTKATAVIYGTQDNAIRGIVSFVQKQTGVKVIAHLEGLPEGEHGFHIHEFGDCSAPDGTSAGGHFNPENNEHGRPGVGTRHIGDLGNMTANESGSARYERLDSLLSLNGQNSIIGRSVVVHANADDFISQPSGAAGERIACGTIGVAKGSLAGRKLSHHFSMW